jgi:nucleoside-diphosphate kinase
MEQTLSIIKPDAVKKGVIGKIVDRFESNGLRIAAMKKMQLDDAKAGDFYAVHKERPFYGELVAFMTSGPVVVMVLEGENAMTKNRDLMGATNPKKQKRVQLELILLTVLMQMQFTEVTHWKMLQTR